MTEFFASPRRRITLPGYPDPLIGRTTQCSTERRLRANRQHVVFPDITHRRFVIIIISSIISIIINRNDDVFTRQNISTNNNIQRSINQV